MEVGRAKNRFQISPYLYLSELRSSAVHNFMIMRVEHAQIQVIGYGESQLIADNTFESGRQQNRRMELLTP